MTNNRRSKDAVLEAQAFHRDHGSSLAELLRSVAGGSGASLSAEFARAIDKDGGNPDHLSHVLHAIANLLASDEVPWGVCPGAYRWHGARISDLSVRLPL